jgi:hypothetical protein
MDLTGLADGWTVWSQEPETAVLAYRPDVFDGGAFPAPCLPTIYLTRGERTRRPGSQRRGNDWHVVLYFEPEVTGPEETEPTQAAAVTAAKAIASRFSSGDIEPRDYYELPREGYLEKLERLTGNRESRTQEDG